MTEAELKTIIKIAQENIPALKNRPNLESQNMDDLDFFDISVWCLKDALIAAYEAGRVAEPAVRARWLKDGDGDEFCENCLRYMPVVEVTGDISAKDYCPNCGAKMDLTP